MDVQTPQQAPASYVSGDVSTSPTHGTRLRNRSSLPAPAKPAGPKPFSPGHVRTQAATPEVISSLIDQLSALALPSPNLFENLGIGYDSGEPIPVSPSLHSLSCRTSFAANDGPGDDAAAYYDALREENRLFPDDACEPPVVRTSKPPSGLSPLTAPKKAEKSHSLTSYIRRSTDCASIHSLHSLRSMSSIGNISIEAGVQRRPSGSSNRSSAESKRSLKGRSLMYMSSREQLKQKETGRKRASIQCLDEMSLPSSPRKPAQLFPYEDTIKEEPHAKDDLHQSVAESSRPKQWYPPSPRRIHSSMGEGPVEQGLVPTRGSSLRHSGSLLRKGKKSWASTQSDQEQYNTAPSLDEHVKMDSESIIKEKILDELEQEESEVAKRIRELRQQKMLRDKLAGKLPEGVNLTSVSQSPSPDSSPISTTSSASEQRVQSFIKAHRLLGIAVGRTSSEIQLETRSERRETRNMESLAPNPAGIWRHSRHRSLTVNDSDDLNLLPVNYNLAIRNLTASMPSSPLTGLYPVESPRSISPPLSSISVSSTKELSSSPGIISRSNSFMAVGGRSAVGRKMPASKFVCLPTPHKHSSSNTSSISGERPLPFRSVTDMPSRPHTLYGGSLASNSSQLQQRRALKKQRWSHPDLPAKAEKDHNDKVDAAEAAAVQKPSRLILEERHVDIDFVGIDVNNYLNASRLSQKIRHPQTGRIISFSEVGDPEGFAVFVCVGMGLTRYVMAFYDKLALTLKLRLITPDRPGIGGSQADPIGTPLSWPDDVLVICQALKITKFSLLAHSAGAVYALATSLRMPQHIRGRVHLLAPWIPPSQMAPIGISQYPPPTQQLPRSQRFLRTLSPSLLKIANSAFLSSTSASLQRTVPKNSSKTKRRVMSPQVAQSPVPRPALKDNQQDSMLLMDQILPNATSLSLATASPGCATFEEAMKAKEAVSLAEQERQRIFDERLTFAIWDRATANANPATDLIVCLETKQTIGFRYEDINRPVVIHHGSKDSRVPADNVRWLGKLMRKCEVRILEGEPHGLMASASVMGNVLTEIAEGWEDWTAVTSQSSVEDMRALARRQTAEKLTSSGV